MDMTGRGGRPTRKVPLPKHPGNTYLPFKDLIKLEKIDDRTYRSIALPFAPGGPLGVGRSYGAHVYMQACYAACQTVAEGFLIHNVSGNFILSGELTVPFVYKVHIIRNGRSYCTRIVNVTQSQSKGICFTCTVSFKTPEPLQISAQENVKIFEKYSSVLHNKSPTDFPECPSMDLPFYYNLLKSGTVTNDSFPGLECRKVDMSAYNRDLHPLDRRQLIFYRTIGTLPSDDPNMHLCAHIFATDRNSLYIVANHFELGDYFTAMSSLAHTVTIHSPMEELRFGKGGKRTGTVLDDRDGKGRWFCMEVNGDRIGYGRALYHGRFWSSDGTHIMTAMQDGLIRFTNKQEASAEERKFMDEQNLRWRDQSKRRKDEKL
ncbi:Acyl-coenzyme A thioesterase 8 [Pseudocercospora fuligena]|uniref:Acyl-coenzyme A thioesterase 8 n=1 Tax=Pseudocercospora fuligena TaxID=685502 RepID=A0A8H6R7I2_9PEZI|nr:Acyl-coenzyme A thioesterase 8 [Pseudocercospora fuligena]